MIKRIEPLIGAELDVVGNEVARSEDCVEHGMPARFHLEDRLGDNLGTTVAVPRGQFGQRRKHVELGQDGAGLNQARCFGGDPVAQRREKLVFQLVRHGPRREGLSPRAPSARP